MSEKIKSDGISRRSVFLLFGLAAAFGLAAPATMLAVSDAEAQADNPPPQRSRPERRHERREHCRERRQERHEHRSERREERRTGADAKK